MKRKVKILIFITTILDFSFSKSQLFLDFEHSLLFH